MGTKGAHGREDWPLDEALVEAWGIAVWMRWRQGSWECSVMTQMAWCSWKIDLRWEMVRDGEQAQCQEGETLSALWKYFGFSMLIGSLFGNRTP